MKRLFMACLLAVMCFSFAGSVFAVVPDNNQKTAIDKTFVIEVPKTNPAEGKTSEKEQTPKKQKKSEKEKAPKKQKATEKEKAPGKQETPKKQKAPIKQKTQNKQAPSKEQTISAPQKAPKKQESIRVALILPNSIDDMAASQSMHEGLTILQEHYAYLNKTKGQKKLPSIDITVIENLKQTAKAAKIIHKYAKNDFDLIITHGAQYGKVLATIAPKYPKVSFAYGPASATTLPNIFTYEPQGQEGAYLLGMLAGFLTKSNTIAIVDSAKKGNVAKFNQGFVKGVQATNTKAQVHIADTNSSKNKASIEKAVKKYILMDADIICSSGPQSLNAIKAVAESSKVLWVGSTGANPVSIAPKTVLAAQVYDFSQVFKTMLTLRDENIRGGKTIPLNVANGYEYIQYNQGIRSDYMKALNKAKEAIKNGSLLIVTGKPPAITKPATKPLSEGEEPVKK